VFLTSLSLRGFKSFADKTMLDVEPGITVIVGPNGSGKSNVVDALSWVLGTASPKKVRGGSMADVIFAGSPSRSAHGSARVEITIDNSEGVLGTNAIGTSGSAQQFSEVRVAREIYASGESGYLINGEDVRALDVQELLSDTGLGRELHTIVGQGQLDEILNAKPEERRKYIEEAAGILKHRRRRERALRKLESVDEHIDKLRAVLRELRRQLRPLERQAEAADKYQALQAQLRDVQVRLVAHDLAVLVQRRERQGRADADAAQRERHAEAAVAQHRAEVHQLEGVLAQLGPRVEAAQRTYYELSSLNERLRGTAELVAARRRHLVEYVEEPLAGRPPEELRGAAERADRERAERQSDRDQTREHLEQAVADRRAAELARREHDQARQAEARRRAEARERVLRWEGEVSARRGSIAATESELGRVSSQLSSLDDRVAEAEGEVTKVQDEIQTLDVREVELTEALEAAEAEVAREQGKVDEVAVRERDLERERASHAARAEALRAALAERAGGTAALLDPDAGAAEDGGPSLDGLLGPVADHVRVDDGAGAAIAAALGPLGEAVVVTTPEQARRAIAWLRSHEAGGATVLATREERAEPVELAPDTVAQLEAARATPLADTLHAADGGGDTADRVVGALRSVLARTWLVPTWDAAVLLHGRQPALTFVTPEGDLAGPYGYRGGQSPTASAVVTATAADEAEASARDLAARLDALSEDAATATAALARAKQRLAGATERINESDAAITGAAERLARLNKELVALSNQREVVAAQQGELTELLARDREALSELHGRGPSLPDEPEVDEGPDLEAERLDAAVETARERELEIRVSLERVTEQVRHLEKQAGDLRREADEVEVALAEAARRREARRAGIARCGTLAAVCATALEHLGSSIDEAAEERDGLQATLRARRQSLATAREALQEAEGELGQVREVRHEADLRRADLDHHVEQLTERLTREFGLSVVDVTTEHPDAVDYERPALVEQEDVLVRKLGLLGRVNPLALEEFKALEERHTFLSNQLEDLRQSKRDLEEVVVAVDERIRQVFAEAYEDIAREFQDIFTVMFPGGFGRLTLTDPEDMLTTGIEVEARPPGKKVTRLSLLSGGERSLTVLAFVFAIFRARPSPFYVLDEVDAALDDVNLQRLLEVIESFRGSSQIIMVTHQKRSMEIADVLYGVTMGPDAVTKVVAQRFDELEARGLLATA
jgi:chromosome segregation protein